PTAFHVERWPVVSSGIDGRRERGSRRGSITTSPRSADETTRVESRRGRGGGWGAGRGEQGSWGAREGVAGDGRPETVSTGWRGVTQDAGMADAASFVLPEVLEDGDVRIRPLTPDDG